MNAEAPSLIQFQGKTLEFFPRTNAQGLTVDYFMTEQISERTALGYGRGPCPTEQQFGDGSLDYTLRLGWPSEVPSEISSLVNGSKSVVFDSHGNQHPEKGWAAHLGDEFWVPVPEILKYLRSLNYETVLFSICNPESEDLSPQNGSVIYAHGTIKCDSPDFSWVVKKSEK